jgi:hypothetical protein
MELERMHALVLEHGGLGQQRGVVEACSSRAHQTPGFQLSAVSTSHKDRKRLVQGFISAC